MYAKIQITGDLEVKTGMHIGGNDSFSAIGAVDSPVIKDIKSNLPIIPGSSLKGKMRSLLAKEYNTSINVKPDDDAERLTRLFGTAKPNHVKRSRILISDMVLANDKQIHEYGIQSMTEVKFENTINRATAVAMPRQIERVIRGSVFELDMIYELENTEEFLEDIETLAEGFRLLQYDYLGGHGSRGYGKVVIHDLDAALVIGEVDDQLMEECNKILKGVSQS